MSRFNKLLRNSRSAMGLQIALAMLVPAKVKAITDSKGSVAKRKTAVKEHHASEAPPALTGRWDFSRLFEVAAHPEIVRDAGRSAQRVQSLTRNTVHLLASAAHHQVYGFQPAPMSHEEVRLWLQSFNAGPYACLKYKGDVPYRETQNYVPKVLKNYERVTKTPYDEHIVKSARKYGLDPQMIRAIMKTESDFRNSCVSHAGARGLMQVMPVVWSEVEKRYSFGWKYSSGVFEPEKNIEVACAYLAWLRYDFLPRHFEAYEKDPAAPVVLKRDRDRGVPDRPTPRIVAKSASGRDAQAKEALAVASADEAKGKVPARETASTEKVTVTSVDDGKVVKSSVAGGKKRVVVRGGKSNAITLNFSGDKPKVKKNDDDETTPEDKRSPGVARMNGRTDEDQTQGG